VTSLFLLRDVVSVDCPFCFFHPLPVVGIEQPCRPVHNRRPFLLDLGRNSFRTSGRDLVFVGLTLLRLRLFPPLSNATPQFEGPLVRFLGAPALSSPCPMRVRGFFHGGFPLQTRQLKTKFFGCAPVRLG